MLAHRLRRWANIEPTMGQRPVLAGADWHIATLFTLRRNKSMITVCHPTKTRGQQDRKTPRDGGITCVSIQKADESTTVSNQLPLEKLNPLTAGPDSIFFIITFVY